MEERFVLQGEGAHLLLDDRQLLGHLFAHPAHVAPDPVRPPSDEARLVPDGSRARDPVPDRVAQGPADGEGREDRRMQILHVADRADWSAARPNGSYSGSTLGAGLAEVGFVHACTQAQLPGVLERFYRDVDLAGFVLLVVDVEACEAAGSAVRWEVPDGASEAFPHLYGPIPAGAVAEVRPLTA